MAKEIPLLSSFLAERLPAGRLGYSKSGLFLPSTRGEKQAAFIAAIHLQRRYDIRAKGPTKALYTVTFV